MRNLVFCGDIHGEFVSFVWNAAERYKIENADIVILGDFGVGFDNAILRDWNRCVGRLEKADIQVYALRGNHDDPDYYNGTIKLDLPRLTFLEDHKVYELAGKKIYTIGGACSADIKWRLEENQKLAAHGKSRKVWWEGEDVVRKPMTEIPDKVDIIVSHEAPLIFQPVAMRDDDFIPPYQYEKILETRKYLDEVLKKVVAEDWYYGHYHKSYIGSYGQLQYRCLGEMEFFQKPS